MILKVHKIFIISSKYLNCFLTLIKLIDPLFFFCRILEFINIIYFNDLFPFTFRRLYFFLRIYNIHIDDELGST